MLKVMLVDDEERILSGLKRVIDWEANGFYIAGAFSDSEEALAMAVQIQPHLIIVDLEMPGLSGLELIDALTNCLPDTKFVVLSAHDQFNYAQQAIKLGVFRYILKPIDEKELINVLRDLRVSIFDNLEESQQRIEMQLDKETHQRSLKSQIIREAICDGFIRHGKENPDFYNQIYHNFSFTLCFIQLRMPLDEQFKFKPCSETLLDTTAEYCIDKLNSAMVFRRENCLVFVIESSGKSISFDTLITELENITNLPIVIGISPVSTGLLDSHSHFLQYFSCFKDISFFIEGSDFFQISLNVAEESEDFALILKDAEEKIPSFLFESNIKEFSSYCNSIYTHLSTLNNKPTPEIIHEFYQTLLSFIKRIYSTIIPEKQKSLFPASIPKFIYLSDYTKYIICLVDNAFKITTKLFGDASTSIINQVKLYIHENYSKSNLKLNKIADEHYINYSYLSYLFKKETGTTFSSYLIDIRMKEAKKLLCHSSFSINEIAKRVGYQNYQNFYYAFLKNFDISPNSFRKQNTD